jgi:hypothetical protein
MTDTWIDGGGVLPDRPLDAGSRIRFSPTGDPSDDIVAYVQDGALHVRGMWKMIDIRQVAVNSLDVVTMGFPPR